MEVPYLITGYFLRWVLPLHKPYPCSHCVGVAFFQGPTDSGKFRGFPRECLKFLAFHSRGFFLVQNERLEPEPPTFLEEFSGCEPCFIGFLSEEVNGNNKAC